MPTPKEQIYDTQIAPLVDQIIVICHQHKIAMILDFALGYTENDKENQLKCLSTLLMDECDPSPEMHDALQLLI